MRGVRSPGPADRALKGRFSSPLAGVNTYRFPNLKGTVVWLPDSQRLAYNTDRNGPIEIHTITPDGRDDTTLKTAPPSYLRLPRGCPIL